MQCINLRHRNEAILDIARAMQAAVADLHVTDAGLDEGDDTEARPVDESAELERMRRFLDDANPEDFDTS